MSALMRNAAGLGARLLILMLAGCGSKLLNPGPPPDLYDVAPNINFTTAPAPVAWQLIIDEPTASSALDTDRILARPQPYEVKYIADARWIERAPLLVQSRLVEAFEKSGSIIGVGRQSLGLRGDYEIEGELHAFDIVYSQGPAPSVHIVLNLKLVRQSSAVIIAAKSFDENAQSAGRSLSEIIAAYQIALGNVLSQVVPWVLSEAQSDFVAHPPQSAGAPPAALHAPRRAARAAAVSTTSTPPNPTAAVPAVQ